MKNSFQRDVLPEKGSVITIRRLGRNSLTRERSVVVTAVGKNSFLGFFVNNSVIEMHFKPSEVEWSL